MSSVSGGFDFTNDPQGSQGGVQMENLVESKTTRANLFEKLGSSNSELIVERTARRQGKENQHRKTEREKLSCSRVQGKRKMSGGADTGHLPKLREGYDHTKRLDKLRQGSRLVFGLPTGGEKGGFVGKSSPAA